MLSFEGMVGNAVAANEAVLACRFHRNVRDAAHAQPIVARTRGTKRATIAVGHAILMIASHLLQRRTTSVDLGRDYFDRRNADAVRRSLVKRLTNLGHMVTLTPATVFS